MKIHTLDTGLFKLDGGAMFGVVPKSLWSKRIEADENNMCTWAMRCLLIENGDQLILVDNGIGDKQDAKFFSHYYLHGEGNLIQSIRKKGYSPEDITDVILTHLHFDHCGGSVKYEGDKLVLTFKNARYWSNEAHWNWALYPNAREKASFLKENILPIKESGHLHFISTESSSSPFQNIDFIFVDGHTEKQMLPKIKYKGKTLLFVADLLPSTAHLSIPWVMGYDVRPLLTLKEKTAILNEACENHYILIFEHDAQHEACTLKMTEKGIKLDTILRISDI